MGVDVDHADRRVDRAALFQAAQDRHRDGVVAAHRDRHDALGGDLGVMRCDTVDRTLDVHRVDRRVAGVGDLTHHEGRDVARRVHVAQHARHLADLRWPGARAGAEEDTHVERHADEGDVEPGDVLDMRQAHHRRDLREALAIGPNVGLVEFGHSGLPKSAVAVEVAVAVDRGYAAEMSVEHLRAGREETLAERSINPCIDFPS